MHTLTSSSAAQPAAHAPCVALWNPHAAANWSLLFSPLFGAYLHMRNWETLGEPVQAARARKWVWASVALLALNIFLTGLDARLDVETTPLRWTTLLALLSWYFGAARAQARYVQARFGNGYPRQRWDQALLMAVLAGLAYVAAGAVFSLVFISVT